MPARLIRRPWTTAALAVFMAAVGAVSLSDRAPSLTRALLRAGREIFHRVELRAGVDLLHRSDIPLEWDTAGHLVLWTVVGALATLAFARRRGLVLVILGLVALSAAVELAQARYSATRLAEWRDLEANAVGITVGAVVARTADVTVAAISRGVGRLRSLSG